MEIELWYTLKNAGLF